MEELQSANHRTEDSAQEFSGAIPDDYSHILTQVTDEAARQLVLVATPPSGKTRLKRMFWTMAGHPPAAFDPIFWPAGMLLLGLWEAGNTQTVQNFLNKWIDQGYPVRRVDDALTGYVLLLLYQKEAQKCTTFPGGKMGISQKGRETGDLEEVRKASYKAAADRIWEFLKSAPKDKEGCLVYYPDHGSSAVFADGIGQSVLFLAKYASVFHVPEAAIMGEHQLLTFYQRSLDRNTGLVYHGYRPETGEKQGIIGWGRAIGWLLMGWSEYLCCQHEKQQMDKEISGTDRNTDRAPAEPSKARPSNADRLGLLFDQLTGNVMRYLRQDHLFSWQLECMEGPSDTSATGMIAWALLHAKREGISDVLTQDAEIEIMNSLIKEVNGGKVFGSSAECIDFGQYPQHYGSYSYAQGAVLAYLGLCLQGKEPHADH